MRSGKEHASQPHFTIPDEGSRASGSKSAATSSGLSSSREDALRTDISDRSNTQLSNTQPTEQDPPTGASAGSPTESNSELYREVLVECNSLVERYRKGEVSKAFVYVEIQSNLARALGNDRVRSDAAFGSFIATVESHDTEAGAATSRGKAYERTQRTPSPVISIPGGDQSDEEPDPKRPKVDESAYAWVSERQVKRTVLRDTLAKTLKLIEIYTIDPKATKRSLVNEPDCPEFPDSEWKNVISGRAVNLDAVLSGQLSTSQDDLKVEKFGDLEISYGAVEPTKVVKNGGDWTIAWNRTVRATVFAFPHRLPELTGYGEYIVNLFSVTHSSVHNRVIAFDKAVRKRIGSVRNLELWDFEKFADLKIAHMDSIGASVIAGSSKEDGGRKGKKGKNWKKDEPCNKWNEGKCNQAEEECRRLHVCNKCRKVGHKGKECKSS